MHDAQVGLMNRMLGHGTVQATRRRRVDVGHAVARGQRAHGRIDARSLGADVAAARYPINADTAAMRARRIHVVIGVKKFPALPIQANPVSR